MFAAFKKGVGKKQKGTFETQRLLTSWKQASQLWITVESGNDNLWDKIKSSIRKKGFS